MVAAGVITPDHDTSPVDCYVYPPPRLMEERAADDADESSESDEGSALVDSDIGYQSNYDSDNEDETAWARSFVAEGPEPVTQNDEAEAGASASDGSGVAYGYDRRCASPLVQGLEFAPLRRRAEKRGLGQLESRA